MQPVSYGVIEQFQVEDIESSLSQNWLSETGMRKVCNCSSYYKDKLMRIAILLGTGLIVVPLCLVIGGGIAYGGSAIVLGAKSIDPRNQHQAFLGLLSAFGLAFGIFITCVGIVGGVGMAGGSCVLGCCHACDPSVDYSKKYFYLKN